MTTDPTEKTPPQPKGLRLGSIVDTPTGNYEARHPITGEGLGAFFVLRGPEHPQRKAVMHRLMREARERAGAAAKPADPADDEAEMRALLADNILGWSHVYDAAGEPVPYSAAEAERLVNDPQQQWLVDQLVVATRRRELFIRA